MVFKCGNTILCPDGWDSVHRFSIESRKTFDVHVPQTEDADMRYVHLEDICNLEQYVSLFMHGTKDFREKNVV